MILINNSCICQKNEYTKCSKEYTNIKKYDKICKFLLENKLKFPFIEVDKAILYKNNNKKIGTFIKENPVNLDTLFVKKIQNFFMDTSNFIWGELSTPYIDYYIEFYNNDNKLLNYISISLDGMVFLYPKFGIEKWGLLSDNGLKNLKLILNCKVSPRC